MVRRDANHDCILMVINFIGCACSATFDTGETGQREALGEALDLRGVVRCSGVVVVVVFFAVLRTGASHGPWIGLYLA